MSTASSCVLLGAAFEIRQTKRKECVTRNNPVDGTPYRLDYHGVELVLVAGKYEIVLEDDPILWPDVGGRSGYKTFEAWAEARTAGRVFEYMRKFGVSSYAVHGGEPGQAPPVYLRKKEKLVVGKLVTCCHHKDGHAVVEPGEVSLLAAKRTADAVQRLFRLPKSPDVHFHLFSHLG